MIDVVFSGLLGTLFGLWAGNRFALWREKRQEFNEATHEIRKKLSAHIGHLENNEIAGQVLGKEVSDVVAKLGEKRARGIVSSFNRYAATIEKCSFTDGYGIQLSCSPGCTKEMLADARRFYKVVQPV